MLGSPVYLAGIVNSLVMANKKAVNNNPIANIIWKAALYIELSSSIYSVLI